VDFAHSPHLSWTQQFFAFGLGIYYSAVYHRTGSLLNPILAHNFWDGVAVASWFLLYWRLHP
jgi:membrane protease YdiL (CAAX protease family)